MPESRQLLARVGHIDPASLAAYRSAGGLQALPKALAMGQQAVLAELDHSGLLGRGGAAFPAARKWRAVAEAPGPRYVVCNADESEPGTFKDRVLMEEDPFAIIEALVIAGLTVGAETGFIYVRGEYARAAARLGQAAAAMAEAGYLGEDVLGSGRSFSLELRRGAGAYICGEETALFNSLEGRRGEPRNKPPFPTQSGLLGRPTLINNVETLANVPLIMSYGAEWFRSFGTAQSTGTKLFCLSGQIARPGVVEVPFGTPLSEVLYELGGGSASGRPLQGVLCGGAAGTYLTSAQFDVPLSFEGLREVGGTIGSGAIVAFDDSLQPWVLTHRIARFFQEESCGQCVPCRVGTMRQLEIIERLRRGAERPGDRQLLREIGQAMRDASICGLGQTAANAVLSALAISEQGGLTA